VDGRRGPAGGAAGLDLVLLEPSDGRSPQAVAFQPAQPLLREPRRPPDENVGGGAGGRLQTRLRFWNPEGLPAEHMG